MSKDSNTQQKAIRQRPPTKIIVERHYVGTEKMDNVRYIAITTKRRKGIFG